MVKISNCYNEGKITCSGDFAGGIAAKMYGTSTDLSTMTNCANIGDVSGSTEYIGGLAGANQGGNIYNSYSLGNVSSGTRVGGLVGIHECNGSSKAHMENCYTSATVTGSGEVGLVVGKCDGATITSCYYNGSQSGVVIGLDNDSQSGEATAYESLSALLTALNSGTSGITDAATWVAGSESYPTFSFVE